MIQPSDLRALAAALHYSDHAFVAIQPADATPSGAACFLLAAPTITAFSAALPEAAARWPTCRNWALIGSDAEAQLDNPTWPAEMHELQHPITLITFTTSH